MIFENWATIEASRSVSPAWRVWQLNKVNDEWAAPLLSAAESQLKAFGGAWWPADRVEIERAADRIQSTLGDKFDEFWEQGQSMGVEAAIAYATNGA